LDKVLGWVFFRWVYPKKPLFFVFSRVSEPCQLMSPLADIRKGNKTPMTLMITTCVSQHYQLRMGRFCLSNLLLPHALAGSN